MKIALFVIVGMVAVLGFPFLLGPEFWNGFASRNPILIVGIVVLFFGAWVVFLGVAAFRDMTTHSNDPY